MLGHVTAMLEVRLASTPNLGTWCSDHNLQQRMVIDLVWTTESIDPPLVEVSFDDVGSSDHAILCAAVNTLSPPMTGSKALKVGSGEDLSFSTFILKAILQLLIAYTDGDSVCAAVSLLITDIKDTWDLLAITSDGTTSPWLLKMNKHAPS